MFKIIAILYKALNGLGPHICRTISLPMLFYDSFAHLNRSSADVALQMSKTGHSLYMFILYNALLLVEWHAQEVRKAPMLLAFFKQ